MATPVDSGILIASDVLDDLEHLRIACQHRERVLRERKGVSGRPLELLQIPLDVLGKLEAEAELELKAWMDQHELMPFVSTTKGLGAKQVARLLAQIGSPCEKPDGEGEMVPRSVRELWSYCGFRPDQGKVAGERLGYNPHAKMRTRMIAEQAIRHRCAPCREQAKTLKELGEGEGWHRPPADCCCQAQGYAYRRVFDMARLQYDSYDVTDLHKHNMALRRVCKEILKDLWREAMRLRSDTQPGEIPIGSAAQPVAA